MAEQLPQRVEVFTLVIDRQVSREVWRARRAHGKRSVPRLPARMLPSLPPPAIPTTDSESRHSHKVMRTASKQSVGSYNSDQDEDPPSDTLVGMTLTDDPPWIDSNETSTSA